VANVYSTKFAERILPLSGEVILYTVPSGFVAVVRDMILIQNGTSFNALVGVSVYTGTGVQVWQQIHPDALSSTTYHWQGRKVMNAGDQLKAFANDPAWSIDVSGYLLTLP
jgi:hypothetical protein